jgi:Uma2 family endonuclease
MPLAVHRFTVDQYHRMGEAGVFHEDDRVELIHGQVVVMTPIGGDHLSCVNRLNALFAPLAGSRATLSVQNPVVLDRHEEPQPDFTALRYREDGYKARRPHAADCLLVIEVGDSSAASDRKTKLPLYARARILEAWLVNLPDDAVEIYRTPRAGRYHDVRTARRGETIAPLAFSDLALRVDDILG